MYFHINKPNCSNKRKKINKKFVAKKSFYIFAKYLDKKRIMFNKYNHTRTSKHTITMCMTMMMWVFEKPQFL